MYVCMGVCVCVCSCTCTFSHYIFVTFTFDIYFLSPLNILYTSYDFVTLINIILNYFL